MVHIATHVRTAARGRLHAGTCPHTTPASPGSSGREHGRAPVHPGSVASSIRPCRPQLLPLPPALGILVQAWQAWDARHERAAAPRATTGAWDTPPTPEEIRAAEQRK